MLFLLNMSLASRSHSERFSYFWYMLQLLPAASTLRPFVMSAVLLLLLSALPSLTVLHPQQSMEGSIVLILCPGHTLSSQHENRGFCLTETLWKHSAGPVPAHLGMYPELLDLRLQGLEPIQAPLTLTPGSRQCIYDNIFFFSSWQHFMRNELWWLKQSRK